MESVHVRESNSEVLIFLDRNVGERVFALEEAVRILQREVIRERTNYDKLNGRRTPDR